jgi:hypothetical protein
LLYKLSFYSDLVILPLVTYYKNLNLKSKKDSFGYIRSFLYIDRVLVCSRGFRRLVTRKSIITSQLGNVFSGLFFVFIIVSNSIIILLVIQTKIYVFLSDLVGK